VQYFNVGKPVILVKQEFQKLFTYSRRHEPLRNQLVIDFPTKMGLRSGEITQIYGSDININQGRLNIRNSKSGHIYPIPIPYEIAEKLERYRYRQDKPLIRRLLGGSYTESRGGTPMHPTSLLQLWHRVAKRAQLETPKIYTPTLGRHYFAAMWAFHPNPEKRGNLEMLRRIMRHKNLAYTQVYLSRLVFFEDIKRDYDRIHNIPQIKDENKMYMSPEVVDQGQVEIREECLTCPAQSVCKYKELLAQVPVAGPCRRRPKILKLAKIESDSS